LKRILFIILIGSFLILTFLTIKDKMEDFFFYEFTKYTNFENKILEQYYATFKPFRNWKTEGLEIKTGAALSVEITKEGQQRFLFNKNSTETRPIASLTKLMTALLALENYDLEKKTTISPSAAMIEGGMDYFKIGEGFYIRDLFYPLLMESSNEAAQALAEIMGEKEFVSLMNSRAKELGLENTYFLNPTGLDPEWLSVWPNYSTAREIAILSSFLLKEPFIWEILRTEKFELYTAEGLLHHRIENNNELLRLSDEIEWKSRILGGKTGWTPRAGECLALVLEQAGEESVIINVVLNAQDRFEAMKNLVDWIYSAYRW
jgi:D-alanyl-D-alanine carboxypeptidase (penicillin-binding protein 5/6)